MNLKFVNERGAIEVLTKNELKHMADCIRVAESRNSFEFREKFVDALLKLRYERRMPLYKIAKALGYQNAFLSEVMNGKRPIPEKMVLELEKIF
jgi:hypothetical protein